MEPLELKTYPIALMRHIVRASSKQDIDRKLTRYGYGFTSEGWGSARKYTITALPNASDRFRIFCVFTLGLSPQTDFRKFRDFIFYFMANDDFNWRPNEMMEEYMRNEGRAISRQTIAGYKSKLIELGFFACAGEFVYYKVFNYYGVQKHELITQEEYKRAWDMYWEWRNAHPEEDSNPAYSYMYSKFGGAPRKQRRMAANAFYRKEINELFNLASESILEEVAE